VSIRVTKTQKALDLLWKIEGVLNSIDLYFYGWRHQLFPGAFVVASVAAGKVSWLPARTRCFTAFPVSTRPVTIIRKLRNRRYTVAGTVWAFHPTSLVTLYGHLRRSNSLSKRQRI